MILDAVTAQGLHQRVQRIGMIDRHQALPQRIIGRMQRNRQIILIVPLRKCPYFRDDAAGADGDVARPDRQTEIAVDDAAEVHDIFIIVKRLTRAHDDDIVDTQIFRIQLFLNIENLPHHFSRRKITFFLQ